MGTFAELIHRRARLVLAATALLTVLAGVVGAGVVGSLSAGGVSDPSAPSERAARELAGASGVSPQPGVVVLVRPAGGSLLGPAGRALIARVDGELRAQPAISRVASPLRARAPATLVSRDGREGLVLGYFSARTPDHAATAAARRVAGALAHVPGVRVGGDQLTYSQLESTISSQLPEVELVAFTILLVLSLLAFRGLAAAALPLMVGAVAVAGSLLIMRALAEVTSLSVYSLNLITGLGLGLAIDYSLFVVYRYREELARRGHCSRALGRTLATAGRTVLFSALTVSVALLSLLVFPQPMLSSMGIAAAVVTLFAAFAALVPLGAVLALLGPRVNALSPAWLRHGRLRGDGPVKEGRWYQLAMGVSRRPLPVATACAVALLAVGLPALHLNLGATDSRVLSRGASARTVDAAVAARFAADADDPMTLVAQAPRTAMARAALVGYRQELARLPGVASAQAPRPLARGLWSLELLSAHPPLAEASQRLVGAVRGLHAPYPTLLSGVAAGQYDQHLSLRSHMALALLMLACTTLVVLFVMTGSVTLAVKSLLMNLLTLCGAFGLLVLIFQDGHLQGLLGYTATGSLEQT
ncbi:MAG TPA: MMPL family transporter, partial [Solirubrobacteraceae bacterium]|nr:MMPL family transporter [Solirubrobacteraceae bacterium]